MWLSTVTRLVWMRIICRRMSAGYSRRVLKFACWVCLLAFRGGTVCRDSVGVGCCSRSCPIKPVPPGRVRKLVCSSDVWSDRSSVWTRELAAAENCAGRMSNIGKHCISAADNAVRMHWVAFALRTTAGSKLLRVRISVAKCTCWRTSASAWMLLEMVDECTSGLNMLCVVFPFAR